LFFFHSNPLVLPREGKPAKVFFPHVFNIACSFFFFPSPQKSSYLRIIRPRDTFRSSRGVLFFTASFLLEDLPDLLPNLLFPLKGFAFLESDLRTPLPPNGRSSISLLFARKGRPPPFPSWDTGLSWLRTFLLARRFSFFALLRCRPTFLLVETYPSKKWFRQFFSPSLFPPKEDTSVEGPFIPFTTHSFFLPTRRTHFPPFYHNPRWNTIVKPFFFFFSLPPGGGWPLRPAARRVLPSRVKNILIGLRPGGKEGG